MFAVGVQLKLQKFCGLKERSYNSFMSKTTLSVDSLIKWGFFLFFLNGGKRYKLWSRWPKPGHPSGIF